MCKFYTFGAAHPHAAVPAGGDTYAYDANGNTLAPGASAGVACRIEGRKAFLQVLNAESRLTSVKKIAAATCKAPTTPSMQWDSAQDGDGTRKTQLLTQYDESGLPWTLVFTIYFTGGLYEETDGTATKYFAIARLSVAMSDGADMKHLLTDRLCSVDVVTDAPESVSQPGQRVLSPPPNVAHHRTYQRALTLGPI